MRGVHLAAYFGLRVIALLENRCEPDVNDTYSLTPLSRAAGNGHGAVVKLLLATDGVQPDSKDTYGKTPLSWAAEKGHETAVKLLLAQDGVDPDSKDTCDGRTPPSLAAGNGIVNSSKLGSIKSIFVRLLRWINLSVYSI